MFGSCYILFPIICGQLGQVIYVSRNWIDVEWSILILIVPLALLARPKTVVGPNVIIVAGSWLLAGIVGVGHIIMGDYFSIISLSYDIKIIVYVVVGCVIYVSSVEDGSMHVTFRWCQMFLAGYVMLEFFVESIMSGTVARPFGSGEINYDAALLCIGLFYNIARQHQLRRFDYIVIIAITVTFSRTAVISLGVGLVILWLAGELKLRRVEIGVGVAAGMASLYSSFIVRGLSFDSEGVDRYWMVESFIDLIEQGPWELLFGYGPGAVLPAKIPDPVAWLWDQQAEGSEIYQVVAFNYHLLWLRMPISFGAVATSAIACGMIALGVLYKKVRGIVIFLILSGFTNGVFYLSNVGVIAIFCLLTLSEPGKDERGAQRSMRSTVTKERALIAAMQPVGAADRITPSIPGIRFD
jgi:hypothetical protein